MDRLSIDKRVAYKGRGAVSNSSGRFDAQAHDAFDDGWDNEEEHRPQTQVQVDTSRGILASNQSPDVPFDLSLNPYRGCEHGCIYCFARPTHAYLGLSPGLDFETRLFSKPDAPKLLEEAMRKPSYQCQTLALGVNTDAYQPIERKLQITRSVLEVLQEYRHPVAIVTKSAMIERDIDILQEMAADHLVAVNISLSTLDADLARKMEPRAAAPHRRLKAIERLAAANIPVSVSIAPIIPVLTDPELETILTRAAVAGASSANYFLLRLPLEVSELFQQWLQAHYPLKADHVMTRVRDTRGGKIYNSTFGERMRGSGAFANIIAQRFKRSCQKLHLQARNYDLNCEAFKIPARSGDQLNLL